MDLAWQLHLWVVVGGNHHLSDARRPHNSLWIINDQGRLVDRYDKRYLSRTELTGFYTPGFTPCTFEVDSFRFGCLLCIEVQFGELWVEQRDLGVDCVLFSTYSDDPIFDVMARGYAAANGYWVSVALPAPCSEVMSSEQITIDLPLRKSCQSPCTAEPRTPRSTQQPLTSVSLQGQAASIRRLRSVTTKRSSADRI